MARDTSLSFAEVVQQMAPHRSGTERPVNDSGHPPTSLSRRTVVNQLKYGHGPNFRERSLTTA